MADADFITKQCFSCRISLPHSDFWKNSQKKDGLHPSCKKCRSIVRNNARLENADEENKKRRAYYASHAPKVLANNSKSRAKHSEKIKVKKKADYLKIKDDPRFKARAFAYAVSRKSVKSEYDRVYRDRMRDHLRAVKAVWNTNNASLLKTIKSAYKARRRAQEGAGDPSALIHAWEKSAEKKCYWCGDLCQKKYHVDHYYPLSKGGKHEVSNLVIACPTCNLRKSAKDPYEFAASIGRLF